MRKLLIGLLLFVSFQAANAQGIFLKGKLVDTLGNKTLPHGVISLLEKKDSALYQFTRSDKEGNFSFPDLLSGKYILLITYPGFADYADEVEVKNGGNDLGSIPLTLKAKLLDAVIIRSSGGIRIKGDTTEFIADSFHLREGTTVEDLLKKFPGFQVNSKGEITAQGRRVDKVLVDGEEFFGDDPTMATQNLSSKTVDKVQLFDTKTDEETLSGSPASGNTKTLNIKLKDEFKKGSFGKIEAASDFNKLHDAKVLYNRFRNKQKFSVFGTKSNTSTGDISWEDKNKFGLDNNDYEYDEVGGFFYSFGAEDEFSDWNLKGLPDAYTAGGIYINKWNQDRQSLNASYRYNRLGTTNRSSLFSKTILPDSVLISNKLTNGYSLLQQSAPSFKYDWKIDSLTTISFKNSTNYKTNKTINQTYSETDVENSGPLNNSTRVNNNSGNKLKTDNLLSYKQQFKKPGRLLTASVRYTYGNNNEDNFINSLNHYFRNGVIYLQDSTDQEKIVHSNSSTMGSSISYTEPLSKKWVLAFSAAYNQNHSSTHLNTFDKSANGKYENFSDLYSSNFDYNASGASGTVRTAYNTKKINFGLSTGLARLVQRVHDLDSGVTNNYHFIKLLPQMQFRYLFKPQTGISFRYRGATQQPTIEQLQPLKNNSDPLNVFVGNPNLKVGFNHNFNLSYNSFRILSQRYIYASMSYTMVSNAVTTSSIIDSNGRRISSNINTNGNHNLNFWSSWYKSQGEGKWGYGLNLQGNSGASISFVNGQESLNQFTHYTLGISFGKSLEGKYDFSIRPEFGQDFSSSSLQPENKIRYFSGGGNAEGSVNFLKKFELSGNIDAQFRQKITASDNNTNAFVLNGKLSRKLFKKDVAKISILANDIFDQNKGVNRITNSNFITDERYNKVSRYFQLKFEWSFNTNPGSK